MNAPGRPPLDAELRALLVCPVCRGELTDAPDGVVCEVDRLLFPFVDGHLAMLPELARRLEAPSR